MHTLPTELQIYTTSDGSPTLAFRRDDGYVEKMHHSGGALSESLYIYHHGLAVALDRGWPARVLSIGLGLAYNELIALAEFHKRGIQDFKVYSFEAHEYLREEFRAFLLGEAAHAIAPIHDQVLGGVAKQFDFPKLREFAREALLAGRLELRGAYPQDAKHVSDCCVVFFDAYSNKMSPELWREEDLQKDLSACLGLQAVLTTYAATGALNRVLRNLGFQKVERAGFLGKRESTFALREKIE